MPGISLTPDRPSHTLSAADFAGSPRSAEMGFGESLAASLAAVPARRVDAPAQLEQRSTAEMDHDDEDTEAGEEAQGSSGDAQRLPEDDAHADEQVMETDREAAGEAQDAPASPHAESPATQSDHADRPTVAADETQLPRQRAEANARLQPQEEKPQQARPQPQPQSHVKDETRPADSRTTASPMQPSTQPPTQASSDDDPVQPSPQPAPKAKQQEQPAIEPRGRDRMDAAVARAMQVETAIRLENATGQPAAHGDGSARPGGLVIQGAAISGSGVSNGGEQNASLPQSHNIDDERFTGRIVRGLTTMINQRGGSMTMRLDPPELGQLRVQMTISRGIVAAQFTASTAQAHALLDKNMATLRLALESQGLTVDRLSVHSTQSGSSQHQAMNDNASDKHNHQRQDAGDGRSRGRRDDAHRQESPDPLNHAAGFAGLVANFEGFDGTGDDES